MRKNAMAMAILAVTISLVGCSEKENAKSVAQKWCDLNGIEHRAAEGADKDAARANKKKYEADMEAKHDKAFMEEVGKEVEKCEDASEGRK